MSKHSPIRVAIIATEFHADIMDAMISAAESELSKCKAKSAGVTTVPGSFEIPFILNLIASRKDIDAIVVLGYIERGETLHGEIMGHVVSAEIIRLEEKHNKPVGIGIIGPGATHEQAKSRKELYARNAVRAAIRNLEIARSLRKPGRSRIR